jgi:hypothetical protein
MKFKQNLNQLTGTFNRLAAAIWIGASLLTACTPSTETVPVTTANSPAALSTVAFTPVLTATPRPQASPSTKRTPAPTTTPNQQCRTFLTEMPPDLHGVLVMQHDIDTFSGLSEIVFFDLSSGDFQYISAPGGETFSTSQTAPDGRHFLVARHGENGKNRIDVYDSQANLARSIPTSDLAHSLYWITAEQILVLDEPGVRQIAPFDTYQPEAILTPYPKGHLITAPFEQDFSNWPIYRFANLYDPTLTRMVYQQKDNNQNSLVFLDLESNRNLNTLDSGIDYGEFPVWSPDGTKFAIYLPSLNKLVVTNSDGAVLGVLGLFKPEEVLTIDQLAWSPDSQTIAFVYDVPSYSANAQRIGTFNPQTQQINYICITMNSYEVTKVFWSPDNAYLAVAYAESSSTRGSTLIVSLTTDAVYLFKKNYHPIGWMASQ